MSTTFNLTKGNLYEIHIGCSIPVGLMETSLSPTYVRYHQMSEVNHTSSKRRCRSVPRIYLSHRRHLCRQLYRRATNSLDQGSWPGIRWYFLESDYNDTRLFHFIKLFRNFITYSIISIFIIYSFHYLFISLFVYLFIYLCIYLFIYLFIWFILIYWLINLFIICFFTYFILCIYIHVYIYLYILLFVSLFIYLSIYFIIYCLSN